MNRLLRRQIKRYLGGMENVPESMMPFLDAVARSYQHYEDDKVLQERIMSISSEELEETNSQLMKEAEKQTEVMARLKESLNTLLSVSDRNGMEDFINEESDILKVVDFIEIQSRQIKKAEREILQVQHFINQSNDAIQVMDADGRLVFANHNALLWLDSNDSPMGPAYGNFIYDIDCKFRNRMDWENLYSLLLQENPCILERQQCNGSTGFFPVEISLKYVRLQNEDFVICVSRDISSRKEAKRQQEELIARLTSANMELENFAYIVSHDLKAPIRGIGSLTSWLKDDYEDVLDDEGKRLLDLMERRVLRMQQLIEGILHYSRVGRMDTKKESVDLNQLINDIVDNIAAAKAPNLRILVPRALPMIYDNPVRVEQVFQNLISNAIKYSDKETCVVEVGHRDRDEHWEFYVRDNGPGIEERYHEKIFKIFQTLQARDSFESTGIGLSIIKKIVEQGKGRIWLESEMGQGTTFFFTLPKE